MFKFKAIPLFITIFILYSLPISAQRREYVSCMEIILANANSYINAPYLTGGMTNDGIDCSGLVYNSFRKFTEVPRTCSELAKEGYKIKPANIKKGDLLFFATDTSSINTAKHVGIVYSCDSTSIQFIHATSSKGVMISSLNEEYWKNAYLFTRRVISQSLSNSNYLDYGKTKW